MMKKFLLILIAMSSAAISQTIADSAVDTSKHAAIDTSAKHTVSIDTSAKQITAIDTSAKHTAGIDTSAKQIADIDTSTKHTVGIDTSTKQIAGIDTSTKQPISIDTSTKQITAIDTSAKQAVSVDTSTKREGFRLPAYTFHAVIMAVSAAIIAATLYFFLTRRRRNESRRFLTTTRLSVLDKSVQRGCRHIESNYQDPALTPETVCRSLVTGKAYLDALFMNELGINVQDFIIQVRVNAIKNHIASTLSPDINDICAKCGFADRAEAELRFANICNGVSIIDYARSHRGGR